MRRMCRATIRLIPASAQRRGEPLPATPETAKKDNGPQPQDVAAELRQAWQDRTGSAAQQAEALAIYQRLAAAGNATAQINLADMYHDGIGAAADDVAARSWLEKAAAQGNSTAQLRLANMCRDGMGGGADYPRALALYRQVAESGNGGAAQALGALYMKGLGVERDDKAAVEWFRRGADAGHPGSMYSLGLMYQKGRGVAKDAAEALRWLEKAAAGGYARANDAIRTPAPGHGAEARRTCGARGGEGKRSPICSSPAAIARALTPNARRRSGSINVSPTSAIRPRRSNWPICIATASPRAPISPRR